MFQFLRILRRPGARDAFYGVAPTQRTILTLGKEEVAIETVQDLDGFTTRAKNKRLDRWLDWVVMISGSEAMFLFIMVALLTWIFLAIPFGHSENWQVLISVRIGGQVLLRSRADSF